jgi:hypothetical protein
VHRLVAAFARAGLIAAALALGLALAFGVHQVADEHSERTNRVVNLRGAVARALANDVTTDATTAQPDPVAAVSQSELPDDPAPTPRDAVDRFLGAEVAQQYGVSYGLLSARDRDERNSRAAWTADHADLPPIAAYRFDGVQVHDGRADVAVALRLHSQLSPTDGLVPARARATLVAVAEDGGWRVAFGESALAAEYPSTALAPDAVRSWARARVECRHAPEFVGGLLGAAARADELCGARGAVQVGRAVRLPETDQDQPFLAAFGSEVHEWSRVVPVDAPVRLRVVVAPLGERWLVVGVLPAPSERS